MKILTVRKEVAIHVIFWLIYSYFFLIKLNRQGKLVADFSFFIGTWMLVFAVTFYFNYLIVLPFVFKRFSWAKVILGILISLSLFILLRYLTEQVLADYLLGIVNYFRGTDLLYYVSDNLYFASQPVIISSIFWMIVSFLRLSEDNLRIVEEQKSTEIKFLKAQINPHFVFNTLNNIYSMVYFKSEKSLEAIEKLGNIMRFTTYESQKDSINIEEEIAYIESYIELECLRHPQQNFVRLEISANATRAVRISPYILSPLVENALKHGLISENDPIRIRLNYDDEQLFFSVINVIGKQQKDQQGGVGLDNLKRRLAIYYPEKNKLEHSELNEVFTVTLQIEFS